MSPMLSVRNLNVHYGGVQALWDVSLDVDAGEIVSLVGPNGAGKSTLLKSILGLITPTSGVVEFEGKDVSEIPAYKTVELGLCYIPEGGRVFPEMTVLENLEMGAIPKRARVEMKESMRMVFDLFPILKERSSQLAGTLSGGERQMLAIARGLMNKPRLMMIDEPSLGLAPKVVLQIFDVIREINERDVTILLVEQNVRQTLKLSNRTYILESGKIVKHGPSSELIDDEYVKQAYLGM